MVVCPPFIHPAGEKPLIEKSLKNTLLEVETFDGKVFINAQQENDGVSTQLLNMNKMVSEIQQGYALKNIDEALDECIRCCMT